jgi:hypothetical protein
MIKLFIKFPLLIFVSEPHMCLNLSLGVFRFDTFIPLLFIATYCTHITQCMYVEYYYSSTSAVEKLFKRWCTETNLYKFFIEVTQYALV